MDLDNKTTSKGCSKVKVSKKPQLTQPNHSQEKLNIPQRTMEDHQEEYSVERLLREEPGDSGPIIEVKWKGWTSQHNTWELRSQLLEDIPDMVAEFDSRPPTDSQNLSEKAPSKPKDLNGMISSQTSTAEDVSMAASDSAPEQLSDTSLINWIGWAELENDPLIFTTLLREWGVQGVGVREVIPLDSVFDTPVSSTLGLIFLSRYIVFDQGTDVPAPSEALWFANQISSFSCATVALMNIINNRPDVQLGPELQTFRQNTQTLSPKDRGLALDNLSPIRDIHNSFATHNDKLYVDIRLRDDAKTHTATKRAQARWKGRKGRKKAKGADLDDESGLHFVAFVPAMDHLWRLDGLERSPTSIGRIGDAENWLKMVVPVLEAQFNAAAMNDLEFSLLSVVLTGSDAEDEKEYEKMRRVREDWGPLMATMLRLHAEKGNLKTKLERGA